MLQNVLKNAGRRKIEQKCVKLSKNAGRILLDHVRSCRILSDHVAYCRSMSDHVAYCLTISDHIAQCRTISNLIGQGCTKSDHIAPLRSHYVKLCWTILDHGRRKMSDPVTYRTMSHIA